MRFAFFLLGMILGSALMFTMTWGYFRGYANAGIGFVVLVPIVVVSVILALWDANVHL